MEVKTGQGRGNVTGLNQHGEYTYFLFTMVLRLGPGAWGLGVGDWGLRAWGCFSPNR